jgi:outer membrane protein OmpA-like peptidoglycan-associated protein
LLFIDFRPGAAELDPAAADKARALVKAMNERPQLKIEVPIAWVGELDRPAMVEAQFLAQVREAQSSKAGRKQSTAAATALEQMDPAAQTEILTQLYTKNLGGEPKFPPAVTSLKAQPALAAAKAEYLKQALHEHIVIADADLTALGQQRATAVQQVLLTNTEMDPARVFLVVNDKAKNHDGQVRLELSLK